MESRILPIESLQIGDETEFGIIDEHDIDGQIVNVKVWGRKSDPELGKWREFNVGDLVRVYYSYSS